MKWQDGKPITCEDFKYGASRTFAHRRHHRWTELHLNFLDIPAKRTARRSTRARTRRRGRTSTTRRSRARATRSRTTSRSRGRTSTSPRVSLLPSRRSGPTRTRATSPTFADLLRRPVQAAGHVRQGQGRHVRPQPELGPRNGPGPQGLPRQDHLQRRRPDGGRLPAAIADRVPTRR